MDQGPKIKYLILIFTGLLFLSVAFYIFLLRANLKKGVKESVSTVRSLGKGQTIISTTVKPTGQRRLQTLSIADQKQREGKIIAKVNGEEISDQFLLSQIKNNCLVGATVTQEQALNTWIDFLILRQQAEKLGIESGEEKINKEQYGEEAAICPEKYIKFYLKQQIEEKILSFRLIENLIVEKENETKLKQLVSNYQKGSYQSLYAAARFFLSNSQSYHVAQRRVIAGSATGTYMDPNVFQLAFSLQKDEISGISRPTVGEAVGKLLVIRIVESGNNTAYSDFDSWFNQIKSQTKIEIIKT